MNVEIVEFYPIEWNRERDSLTGTLRIRLPDIGIHILGVFVSKRNGSWFFSLPGRKSEHHETGEMIRYPFFVFEDRDHQKQLMAAIREKAPAFVEKRLTDIENPLIFPKNLQKQAKQDQQKTKQRQPQVNSDNTAKAKETTIFMDPKLQSIALEQWATPPPRKPTSAMGASKFARC